MVDEEALVGVLVFVDADGQYGDLGVLALEFEQRRQLKDAGDAPTGPEVHENDFAFVVGEMNVGGAIGDVEVRRGSTCLRGMVAAVAAGDGD